MGGVVFALGGAKQQSFGSKVIAMYQCINCGKPVKMDLKATRKVQCPFCGHRILTKTRPKVPRKVLAQ